MKRSGFFPSRFLRHADLQGRPQTVIIKEVIPEDVGADGKLKPVISFRGKEKTFVCNATNYDVIADAYGDETDNWPGQPIELYPTKVPFKGQLTDAIRVRIPPAKRAPPSAPAPAPKPTPASASGPAPAAQPAPASEDLNDEIPF